MRQPGSAYRNTGLGPAGTASWPRTPCRSRSRPPNTRSGCGAPGTPPLPLPRAGTRADAPALRDGPRPCLGFGFLALPRHARRSSQFLRFQLPPLLTVTTPIAGSAAPPRCRRSNLAIQVTKAPSTSSPTARSAIRSGGPRRRLPRGVRRPPRTHGAGWPGSQGTGVWTWPGYCTTAPRKPVAALLGPWGGGLGRRALECPALGSGRHGPRSPWTAPGLGRVDGDSVLGGSEVASCTYGGLLSSCWRSLDSTPEGRVKLTSRHRP